jgi:biopolymer transport protein ExbB
MTLIRDGGFMMYPLILCSLVAVGVIIAKAWTLWVAHRESRDLLQEIKDMGRRGRLDEAMELAEETPGPVAAIMLSGLRRIEEEHTEGDLQAAINTTGSIELDFLERGLVVLATIANVAPMLGFLGTVIGMILAFGAIESAGQVEPALVAGGIKVALITTAAGLAIAVPVHLAHHFFISRVDQLVADMEQGAQAVLDLIWELENRGGAAGRSTAGSATTAAESGN